MESYSIKENSSSQKNLDNENETVIKDSLNEYFKLKFKYDTQIITNKKKLINNPTLSNREKRSEYLKLKPKCINCKRPGGSIFKTIFIKETDKVDSHRQYIATCGIIADPCNLNIKIEVGNVELLSNLLNEIQKELRDLKNTIIDDKNKLLFGYIDTEKALENFEDLKDAINVYSSIYERYLENYNNIVDNDRKKESLKESITSYYILIEQIKECISKMKDTDNVQFAKDAVNIYQDNLRPLMNRIRDLSYDETKVWHDIDSNTCNLIQNKYSIQRLSYSSFQDKVVSFNIGLETNFTNKNKNKSSKALIIESSSQDENEPSIEINLEPTDLDGELIEDEPIYQNEEVSWNKPEYTKLWSSIPEKLKNALMQNQNWMKDFMFSCVNARIKKEACTFVTPKDLKTPPIKLDNGEYDFGVPIYNDVFNKLLEFTKQTYLTLYSEKDGIKNYSLLINTMNKLVEKEVNFNPYV
jgi:hypothetical protein